ncbi:hypothetical protein [Stenotrophomonas sp.]|uniref:hypothetical protein n=1 Tax=Stenotrophomonas sp. TaxID=69392 RepID=UPI00289631CB|nr:hypothetical protein [Stenotrophomonas sp.]
MPLNFEPHLDSAVDNSNGLWIPQPQMVPASPPEDPSHNEYRYAIYRGEERIAGIGCFGADLQVRSAGQRERVFTLDLGRDWVLDAVLELKRTLNSDESDFEFLRGLAKGLVSVFENRSRVAYDLRYMAITRTALLMERGIAVPAGAAASASPDIDLQGAGDLLLAQVRIPARGSGEEGA